jgi:hypothetical protein
MGLRKTSERVIKSWAARNEREGMTPEAARAKAVESARAMDAYWAGSCVASVLADYESGNVKTIRAGR